MFGSAAPNRTGTGQPNPDGVFADVFDEVFLVLPLFATGAVYATLLTVTAPRD